MAHLNPRSPSWFPAPDVIIPQSSFEEPYDFNDIAPSYIPISTSRTDSGYHSATAHLYLQSNASFGPLSESPQQYNNITSYQPHPAPYPTDPFTESCFGGGGAPSTKPQVSSPIIPISKGKFPDNSPKPWLCEHLTHGKKCGKSFARPVQLRKHQILAHPLLMSTEKVRKNGTKSKKQVKEDAPAAAKNPKVAKLAQIMVDGQRKTKIEACKSADRCKERQNARPSHASSPQTTNAKRTTAVCKEDVALIDAEDLGTHPVKPLQTSDQITTCCQQEHTSLSDIHHVGGSQPASHTKGSTFAQPTTADRLRKRSGDDNGDERPAPKTATYDMTLMDKALAASVAGGAASRSADSDPSDVPPTLLIMASAGEEETRHLLAIALQKAHHGVSYDVASNFDAAIDEYDSACRHLALVLHKTVNKEDQRKLHAIRSTYANRILALKQIIRKRNEQYADTSLALRPCFQNTLANTQSSKPCTSAKRHSQMSSHDSSSVNKHPKTSNEDAAVPSQPSSATPKLVTASRSPDGHQKIEAGDMTAPLYNIDHIANRERQLAKERKLPVLRDGASEMYLAKTTETFQSRDGILQQPVSDVGPVYAHSAPVVSIEDDETCSLAGWSTFSEDLDRADEATYKRMCKAAMIGKYLDDIEYCVDLVVNEVLSHKCLTDGTDDSAASESSDRNDKGTETSASPSASTGQSQSNDPSTPKSRKGLDNGKDHDDNDDDDRHPPGPHFTLPIDEMSTVGPRLACPYLHDPNAKHSRACYNGFPALFRLKAHLWNCHTQHPHCPRCRELFDSESKVEVHVIEGTCQFRKDKAVPEGLTKKQVEDIKIIGSKKRDPDEEKKWVDIFKIIFPTVPNDSIPSPRYLVSGDQVQILENVEDELMPALTSRIQQEMQILASNHPNQYASNLLDVVTAAVTDTCHEVFQRWTRRPSFSRLGASKVDKSRPMRSSAKRKAPSQNRHNERRNRLTPSTPTSHREQSSHQGSTLLNPASAQRRPYSSRNTFRAIVPGLGSVPSMSHGSRSERSNEEMARTPDKASSRGKPLQMQDSEMDFAYGASINPESVSSPSDPLPRNSSDFNVPMEYMPTNPSQIQSGQGLWCGMQQKQQYPLMAPQSPENNVVHNSNMLPNNLVAGAHQFMHPNLPSIAQQSGQMTQYGSFIQASPAVQHLQQMNLTQTNALNDRMVYENPMDGQIPQSPAVNGQTAYARHFAQQASLPQGQFPPNMDMAIEKYGLATFMNTPGPLVYNVQTNPDAR